jgi:phosphatidylserine/phosphatidylglycerophosphate/cardiolipin synthase-like enzyme/DNA/RNA endonuclease YhcR with UshA esterase domain
MRRRALLGALAVLVFLGACDRGGTATTGRPAAREPVPPAAPAPTATATPAAAAVVSIAEARGKPPGTPVTATGTVTAAPGVFDPRGRKFYVQDDTGGIAVFFAGGGLRLAEGNRVALRGTLTAFNGELEILLPAADAVRVMGTGPPPVPVPVRTGDITVGSYGRLVTVRAGVIAVQGAAVWVDDGSGGVQVLLIPAGFGPPPKPGDAVTVTGITARSKGTLQLLPRRADEIAVSGRWTDPEQAPTPRPRPVSGRPEAAAVKIVAFYPHTYEDRLDEGAEAVRIQNLGEAPVDLGGWLLTDNAQLAVFPPRVLLQPGERVWIAKEAGRFEREFGVAPDFVFGGGDLPATDDGPRPVGCAAFLPTTGPRTLCGGRLRFANLGGEVALLDPEGAVADAAVYGLGRSHQPGWRGPALQPYLFDAFVWPAGQVFSRKRDQATGRPLPDTDTAADWVQDPADPVHGRRLLYAGWSQDEFFFPAVATEQATTRFLLAPDNLFEATAALIDSAHRSIDVAAYTFSNPYLVERIVARQREGVRVRALFDGGVFNSPDGSYDEVRWAAQQIVRHGGRAWFWTDVPDERLYARYNNHHQKYLIVDDARVLITSENFEQTGMPADPKTNGTAGNRGAGIITDAPSVVARLRALFATDADPRRPDIRPVALDRAFAAPAGRGDPTSYVVRQPSPLTVVGPLTFEVVQSPETALRAADALLGMVARAGPGDTVLVQQQYEHLRWHGGLLNPRLEAYVAAARRGATVLILLDAVNDAGQNQRTLDYLHELARREGLRIEGRLASPAGGPIHNKMVLVTAGAEGWVHVSSINGSENSSVFNREVGLQVRSLDGYRYFAQAFAADWRAAGGARPVDTRGPTAPTAMLDTPTTRGVATLAAECDCEYFVDVDPGPGQAAAVRGTAAIDTAALGEGPHVLYVRQRDAAGVWGALTPLPFTVARAPP